MSPAAAVLELDHLPFGVADAEAIGGELQRLGFTPTAIGVCRWTLRGTSYAARATSVVLERGYLDLIEIPTAAWKQHLRTSPVYGKGIAPTGIVLASASLEATRSSLSAKGVASGDPYAIVRDLPGADPPEIRYRIFALREPCLPISVIEDRAPRALRRPEWLHHPNTATGIRRLHLRVPSLGLWLDRAGRVLEAGAAPEQGPISAALVAHDEVRDPYLGAVSALLPQPERTTLLAVEFAVADLRAAREALARGGLPAIERDGGVAVEPRAGYGCGVVFSDASSESGGEVTGDAACGRSTSC